MRKLLSIALMAALLLCGICKNARADDYKFVKKDGAVRLYERWIAKAGEESVREIKAVFVVNAKAEDAISLLKDPSRGKRWNSKASVYKIMGGSVNQWLSYVKYDMPMIDDQDCCLQFQLQQPLGATNAYIISFFSTHSNQFPITSGVKRISGVKGRWILQPAANNNLKITYIISSDRNKNIPRFIADPIIQNNLFKTMQQFKNILES